MGDPSAQGSATPSLTIHRGLFSMLHAYFGALTDLLQGFSRPTKPRVQRVHSDFFAATLHQHYKG